MGSFKLIKRPLANENQKKFVPTSVGHIVKYLSMLIVSDTEALCNWTLPAGRKGAAASRVQTQLDELKCRFGQKNVLSICAIW
jgi:hypothetical protein